jgi:hypothetical protein
MIFHLDRADFIEGRQKPFKASEVVEKIGSDEGSGLDRAL